MLAWGERHPDGPAAMANPESRYLKRVGMTGPSHTVSGYRMGRSVMQSI